jgi:hypothetical protein
VTASLVVTAAAALAVGLAALTSACGGGGRGGEGAAATADAPASTPPGVVAGAPVGGPRHPTPYTSAQLRAATKAGRTYRYRVEAAGKPPSERVMTFVSVDSDGADLVTEGEGKKRMTWEELRRQAEFPEAIVRTREEKVTVPAGTFDCVVYVVLGEGGEATSFYYAKDLPGAPVQLVTNKEGRRVMTSKLVEHRPGK